MELTTLTYCHFFDALELCQLYPRTAHQAAGQQKHGYTASVGHLCGNQKKQIRPAATSRMTKMIIPAIYCGIYFIYAD